MPDRKIVLAENGRNTARGLYVVATRHFMAYQSESDVASYVVDLTQALGSATISSVTRVSSGLTVSATSNTTTAITQSLKGFGHVDINATLSTSEVVTVRLEIRQHRADARPGDYAA